MLVDCPPLVVQPGQIRSDLTQEDYFALLEDCREWPIERLGPGLYRTGLNFGDMVLEPCGVAFERYPFWPFGMTLEELHRVAVEEPDRPPDYGVCDTLDQVVARWPVLAASPRCFLITGTEICKADQPSHGGWRWHKWGDYIGTTTPRHEYLYDEGPDIEAIWVFGILELV